MKGKCLYRGRGKFILASCAHLSIGVLPFFYFLLEPTTRCLYHHVHPTAKDGDTTSSEHVGFLG